MSFLRRALGLDEGADPAAPRPAAATGETESVRRIAARLADLPTAEARRVAAFAYLLARAAHADLAVTDAEEAEIARIVAEVGGLDPERAALVAALAGTRAADFGATEDFLVTREFKGLSTPDERARLLRCCLLVMAADDEVDANEAWLVNRIAEELDVERPDVNRIREEFHDRISGVRAVRRLRGG